MRFIQIVNVCLLFLASIACANDHQANNDPAGKAENPPNLSTTDSFEAGKVISPVICKANPAQSYAIYIPVNGNKEALPVIYFFDPHGNGSFPLGKYKALADRYHFIFIGSNNSKNGNDLATAEDIWNYMFNDSQGRIKINAGRIYVCGFSGGARVASHIALQYPQVKGVIANSAGMPDAAISSNLHFSFTGISGEGDMNMTELVATGASLDKTQARHRILFFEGKHEWAPEPTMDLAFAALQFDAMHDKLIDRDDVFINNYIAGSKLSVGNYLKANNYLKAAQECSLSVSLLEGLTPGVDWFKEKETALKKDAAYERQWQSRQKLVAEEQNLKSIYENNFSQGDMNYWTQTIRDLESKARPGTDRGAMYQRLLAYLSLAFYSISNQLIAGHQDVPARHFVDLYKMVDPTNSEAWYFSAILDARTYNAEATESDLLKAVDNGFADRERMMQQPEFMNMKSRVNFTAIASKMNKGK